MSRLKTFFAVYMTVGLMFFGLAEAASAQNTNVREGRNLLRQLNTKIDDFRYTLESESSRVSANRTDKEEIQNNLGDLQDRIIDFGESLQRRRENADDVMNILSAAKTVNDFLNRNRFSRNVNNDWAGIRNLLDRLAANYQVSWRWDDRNSYPNNTGRNPNNNYPNSNNYPNNSSRYNSDLVGTYRLDVSRSENTDEIAARAIANSNIRNNSGARADLEGKLQAPEQLALDVRGNQIILASTKAPPVTIQADGQTRTETINGQTIRLRATLNGNEFSLSTLGGDTDFTITFVPEENGRALRVTRRVTTDYLRQTVFAESVYNKTDNVARLGIESNNSDVYSSNDPQDYPNNNYPNSNYPNNNPNANYRRSGKFVVPNGTIVTGILESEINTKVTQNNDRFTMTVQSPNQYRGATIEGYISGLNRSGRVSGRSQIAFNFERIRLRNGQTYDFAGFLQGVTDENGKTIRVDEEGSAKGGSQTNETLKRGGIGAGVGAILGAIIGGGKGAAIGAIIGGAGGAGSVIVQGRDDLELRPGSTITVQASSPIR